MTTVLNTTTAAPATSSSVMPAQLPSAGDFLKILVAEFQNQDPTRPSDPTQFASQLVQFANLAQLQQIDGAVQQPPSVALMQAASAFIGRQVVAPGNLVGVQKGKATAISYTPGAADSYTADIFNASGQQVASVSLGEQPGGTVQTFTWRPASSIGDGQYTVKIVNSKGTALKGLVEQGVVQSVSLSGSALSLDLGNLVLSDSQVSSVAQPQAQPQ
jgi:flagellar basal-body rod modification protein FlgD